MKCDLANMLRQARQCIDPSLDGYGYEASLEQLEDHVRQVRNGSASLDAFADFYMLRPTKPQSADLTGIPISKIQEGL